MWPAMVASTLSLSPFVSLPLISPFVYHCCYYLLLYISLSYFTILGSICFFFQFYAIIFNT